MIERMAYHITASPRYFHKSLQKPRVNESRISDAGRMKRAQTEMLSLPNLSLTGLVTDV